MVTKVYSVIIGWTLNTTRSAEINDFGTTAQSSNEKKKAPIPGTVYLLNILNDLKSGLIVSKLLDK